jgi:DNA-binding MarR family transcriptional regulator
VGERTSRTTTATQPPAIIHKRILDAAEANPNASIDGLADEIGGASPSLVERVLDQYGDPAAAESAANDPGGDRADAGDPTGATADEPDADGDGSHDGDGDANTGADGHENGPSGVTPAADAGEDDRRTTPGSPDDAADTEAAATTDGPEEATSSQADVTSGSADAEEPAATAGESGDESRAATDAPTATTAEGTRETDATETADRTAGGKEMPASAPDPDPDPDSDSSPTAEATPDGDDHDEEPAMSEPSPDSTDDLTDKQRTVLEAISRHPDATQAELASHLGVSRGTVSNWANSIEGFEWSRRQEFVADRLGAEGVVSDDGRQGEQSHGAASDAHDELRALRQRIDDIEQRVDDAVATAAAPDGGHSPDPDPDPDPDPGPDGPFDDEELVAKVVRACVTDDAITEDEELRILGALLR